MILSAIHSPARKFGITKRKVEETAVAGDKGCATKRKAVGGVGGGKVAPKEAEVQPFGGSEVLQTLILCPDISQREELEILIPYNNDESKTFGHDSSAPDDSDTDGSEPEDLREYVAEYWENMMAELGFEESDFSDYQGVAEYA